MAFDRRIIEAKLALGMIPPEGMPPLAWDALEAGLDGPGVRRMAALERPMGFETDALVPRFMVETGLCEIAPTLAYARLAQALAARILCDDLDPLPFAAQLEGLWMSADHPALLADIGLLEEDVYVARWELLESEESIRTWVLERLRRVAEQELP